MPGVTEQQPRTIAEIEWLVESDRPELRHHPLGIRRRIERQRRLVPAEAVPVGEFGILLLQMGAVEQD